MSDKKHHISIVCPVYGSPGILEELCERLHHSLGCLTKNYEIILVFDCSPDEGWRFICRECKKDGRVKGIRLSRNFGQHYAITAGLEHATGEWVVVMDCDLQDQPEEITRLYQKAQEGFDIVFAQRQLRKDGFLKRWSSKAFYAVFSYMTETNQDAQIANFGIYRDVTIDAVLSMRDYVRYFPTMAQWVGFDSVAIPVVHAERGEGDTNYSLQKLLKLAFDNMVVFSDKPLRLTVKFGMTISGVTMLIGAGYLWRYLRGDISVTGFTSLILSIWFLSGIIIFLLGVLGIYLGKSFDQAKQRPAFIVRDKENFE